jgi:glyoxylase-like metal-dependent hydrolase (beta-lactamase superfamily II)
MKVDLIQGKNAVYTCNVYLVRGEWNRIEDVNTLIDVGNDPSILDVLEAMSTGVGKRKVEQVVLTHSHSDHTAILPLVLEKFHPVVYAFSPYLDGVERLVKGGERLKLGDRYFEVIHMPGHSEDSISLYNKEEAVMLSGDASMIIRSLGGTYDPAFAGIMEDLCRRHIQTIYSGHGQPMTGDIRPILTESLRNIRKSMQLPPEDRR